MMRMNDFIPTNEAEFYPWQGTLLNYISARAGLWGITEAEWTTLSALQTDYLAKYAIAVNPETRTPATVLAKNKAHKAYVKEIRRIVKVHITYNPAVADEDRKNMALPIHKTTRTPVPPPKGKVDFTIELLGGSRIVVHYHAHDEERETKNAKPFGVHGVEFAWAILDAPPSSYADLVHSVFDTRSPYTFQFDLTDAGKHFYCCARWENTRGEKGPWSEIQNAIIP